MPQKKIIINILSGISILLGLIITPIFGMATLSNLNYIFSESICSFALVFNVYFIDGTIFCIVLVFLGVFQKIPLETQRERKIIGYISIVIGLFVVIISISILLPCYWAATGRVAIILYGVVFFTFMGFIVLSHGIFNIVVKIHNSKTRGFYFIIVGLCVFGGICSPPIIQHIMDYINYRFYQEPLILFLYLTISLPIAFLFSSPIIVHGIFLESKNKRDNTNQI